MKLVFSFIAMGLILAGCASAPAFVPNSGRIYAPCIDFEPCIYVVRDVISMNWINPTPKPGPQPSRVLLAIELNADAKVVDVSVARSSGNGMFDESALAAVRRAGDFRELKGLGAATFEHFRKFNLDFNPSAETNPGHSRMR
jgi:TonB family protein